MVQPHDIAANALREGNYPAVGDWTLRNAVRALHDASSRTPPALSSEQAARAAKVLNQHLHYDLTLQLTDAWGGSRFDLRVARHRAQALINQRRLDEAEALLERALERAGEFAPLLSADSHAAEIAELRGLHARIPKDRFVREYERREDPHAEPDETREQALLDAAIGRSLALYRPGAQAWWHGANAIALLCRRAREQGESGCAEAAVIAGDLVAEIRETLKTHREQRERLDEERARIARDGSTWTHWQSRHNRWLKFDAGLHWLLASASEASLALPEGGRDAELWLYRFIVDPRTSPFDLASYERQLREIWQAVEDPASRSRPSRLLTVLTRHIRATTRSVTLSQRDVRQLRQGHSSLEKNFSGHGQFSIARIRDMLGLCASIGRVRKKGGDFIGTGFLVDLASLLPQADSELVFVTNAHVISADYPGAARPDDAEISFELADPANTPTFSVAGILFYSEPGDLGIKLQTLDALDLCVVRLSPSPRGYAGLRIAESLPERGPRTRAYVIGHPRAKSMQVSLHDSALLDYDDLPRLIHYRTPTEPGSSGSPVFDEEWKVIAVHHAGCDDAPRLNGGGRYEANEGVAIGALRARIAREGIRRNGTGS
ncbi:MAG: hypothetical protein AMXMBFR59_30840 [Rhodanobacteraceae bacterium]